MYDEDPALIEEEFYEESADLSPLTEAEIDELERVWEMIRK